jgi:hypothetical protein
MALWFAEIRARELSNDLIEMFHLPNPFASQRDKESQLTVDLDFMAQRMYSGLQQDWIRI